MLAAADGRSVAVRLARLYLVLSRTNRAIEQARDERSLLQAACETVVEVGEFRMSWAATLSEPGRNGSNAEEIVPIAWAGHEDGYLALLRVSRTGERSKGPTGQAITLGRTVICDDIATDPRMALWRDEALARGYRSSLGLPLFRGAETRGVLTVYAETPGAFGPGEVELLEELARDVSLGLAAIEDARQWKRAEAALRESAERFETSIETMLDPFVIMRAVRDEGGRIVDFVYDYANAAACVANRVERAQLIGARLLSLLPEHQTSGLFEAYVRVVETGEPLVLDDLEYEDSWAGDRSLRVFDVRASKLGDGLAYTWRDITERRSAERRRAEELEDRVRERTAELEIARERAYAVAALSTQMAEATDRTAIADRLLDAVRHAGGLLDGAVCAVEDDGRISVLHAFGLQTGVVPKLRALPPDVLTPVRDAALTGELIVIDGLKAFDARYPGLEFLGRKARTRPRLVVPLRSGDEPIGGLTLGFARPRRFDQAEMAFFLSLAHTAAHALERLRLIESEREARGVLESVIAQMPAGVSVVARGRRMLFQNEALRRIVHGSSGLAAASQTPALSIEQATAGLQAYRPDGRPYGPDDWPLVRSLDQGEIVVNEEISLVRRDRSRATIMITSAPVRDATGEIVAAVSVVLDVTERKEAEVLRDAFLGVLSHELRTPVTTIYGGTRLLATRAERLAPDVRADLLGDISAESERLSRLVDDLLVLARAERGVDLTARGAALIQHRLDAVVRALRREWPDRTFTCVTPEHVPPVTGDEGYLEQVLRNLLGNAAKYGRSEVTARVTPADGRVEVTIEDDGPGIDPTELESVFELFTRARATAMLPGAGIGLFVTRRLVEAMGGRVWAANRPGGGARFTFVLPEFHET